MFPSPKSDYIQPVTVYERFREILFQAGIPHRGREKGPCLHSLRHTFAVHSLRKMESDGVDLYCALPVLSTYMGHENIYATERYLRMTAQVHPEIINQLQTAYGDIVPKITGEVTE